MKAVNLLPPDLRGGAKGPAPAVSAGTEEAGGLGAFIVLGALALAVVAVVGYVLASNTVSQRKADLAEATQRSAAVTREVSQLKPYADFADIAKARIKTIQDIAGARFDWDRALADLSRALPDDVTLSELDATVSSDTGAASASGSGGGDTSGLRGALNVPAFELQGCTSGQTDVARLMARLRSVDGVTRVSLAKSDKETPTARPPVATPDASASSASATTSADSSTTADACGRGEHPTFDVIAFFEHAGDAAQGAAEVSTPAAGATATATPTPTPTPSSGGSTSTPTSTTTEQTK